MGEWEEAPEWRRIEASQLAPERRANLRSWSLAVLEPPQPVSTAHNFVDPDSIGRLWGSACNDWSHSAKCTANPNPGGTCGHRGSILPVDLRRT